MIFHHALTDLFYDSKGAGMPVLLVHGYTLNGGVIAGYMEPAFERVDGFRRIYVDLPGMGRTPKGAVQNADDMLTLLCALVEKEIPDGRFCLAGGSFGGYLIRGVASRYKQRVAGMLFRCPSVSPRDRRLPPRGALLRDETFLTALPADVRADFENYAVLATEEYYDKYKDAIIPAVETADLEFLSDFQKRGAMALSFDPDAATGVLEAPALFALGRQDWVTGCDDALALAQRQYPRATVAVLDCAGHNAQIERSEVFTALAADWLRRVRMCG